VLPEDAVVLLVHADRVADGVRLPAVVGEDGVEVVDLAQAVAAELERVGLLAEQVLPGVEVADPEPGRARVAVRDHHLGDRGAVDDRPLALAVREADRVQDEPFAGIERDPQLPVLPRHL
jgi:hypothetical protein